MLLYRVTVCVQSYGLVLAKQSPVETLKTYYRRVKTTHTKAFETFINFFTADQYGKLWASNTALDKPYRTHPMLNFAQFFKEVNFTLSVFGLF